MIRRFMLFIARVLRFLAETWGRFVEWVLRLLGFTVTVEVAGSLSAKVE